MSCIHNIDLLETRFGLMGVGSMIVPRQRVRLTVSGISLLFGVSGVLALAGGYLTTSGSLSLAHLWGKVYPHLGIELIGLAMVALVVDKVIKLTNGATTNLH